MLLFLVCVCVYVFYECLCVFLCFFVFFVFLFYYCYGLCLIQNKWKKNQSYGQRSKYKVKVYGINYGSAI